MDALLLLRAKNVELAAHQAYLGALIHCLQDSLVVMDLGGVVRMANEATRGLLGYREEELIGMPAGLLFAGQAVFKEALERLLAEGTCRRRLGYRTRGGEEIPMDFSGSVARDRTGAVVAVVGVARDLRELLALQTRMAQGEKMAAVGQLAGGVAHEINNPIGIILGFAQSMARRIQAGDHPFALPVKSIEREALRCRDLVQNLLAFSRSSSPEQREEVDVNACVERALALALPQARLSDIKVLRELAPAAPRMVANRSQIEQVVINLCGNSIDAMPGGGCLTVRTGQYARDGTLVTTLAVSDTGTGIPKELQSRVFEPFFTTKEPGKGTGLGLALVYEIAKKHGGTVSLSSEAGKGSTFTIVLPSLGRDVP